MTFIRRHGHLNARAIPNRCTLIRDYPEVQGKGQEHPFSRFTVEFAMMFGI